MNNEQIREYHRNYYKKRKKDPKWVQYKKEISQEHYKKIKETDPERLKRYRQATEKWRLTINGIFISLRNRKRKDFNLNKEEFIKWYENQDKKCSYCNLTLEEIRKLPSPYNRKNGLAKYSIDRKNNDLGYTIDNITLSCFTCNTIKNNFLTYEEMLKIGKEIIEPKLRLLLTIKIT